MIDELLKHNVPVKYIKYGKVGHGVGLAEKTIAKDWPYEAVKFWKEN